ncbi:hypothetical protein ACSFCT_25635 [Yokenella regensburgei]|uniref:hypothetical protein n=1 Tax=Yokenella regensburgei TaxID=158877 RepID=UPI003EDA66C2
MSVTLVIKFTHTQDGIDVEAEINTKADYHCVHEMAHATATVEYARQAAREINQLLNKRETHQRGNKNVH